MVLKLLKQKKSEWAFGLQEVKREQLPDPGGNPRDWE